MGNPVSVKWFDSTMAGAPSLSGEAGKLIDVFDACFINGFGSVTLDSLTVDSGVATATKSGHGFLDHSVILIDGATPSGLNGDKRITWVSTSVFTFDATGISDQTATGTITAKVSPLGYAKTFSGTNKAAYSRTDITASASLFRVDDTGTTSARVRGYESMSDVDTGTGPYPTDAQYSGGLYWAKSSSANSTAKPWVIVGDGGGFYYFNEQTANQWIGEFWIDLNSAKPGDAYHSLLCASQNTTSSNMGEIQRVNATAGHYMPRSYVQTGTSIAVLKLTHIICGSGPGLYGLSDANPAGGQIYLAPIGIFEGTTYTAVTAYRGLLPGCYGPLHKVSAFAGYKNVLVGFSDLPGRSLLVMRIYNGGTSYLAAIDLTGPWR